MKNSTLYGIKLVACFFIICIHIPFPGKIGLLITTVGRFAVPFFFMVSGFFTNFQDENIREKFTKRIKKLLKLAIMAFLLYFVVNIIIVYKNKNIILYINEIKNIKNFFRLIAFNYVTPYIGVGHLWYLLAIIYIYAILLLLNKLKYKVGKKDYFCSFIVLLGVYIFESLNFLLKWNIEEIIYRNFLFFGFPFFLLGNYLNTIKEKLIFDNNKLLKLSFIIGVTIFLTMIIEITIFKENLGLYIYNILLCIYIFIFSINFPNLKFFSEIGRKYSSPIYIIHYIIIIFMKTIFVNNIIKHMLPIIVFMISLMISIIIEKIELKLKMRTKNNGKRNIYKIKNNKNVF